MLSTLHTNDTASAVTRLVDMGIQPFQISSAVLGVAAVRLVRKLCTGCRESYEPNERELALLGVTLTTLDGRKIFRSGGGCERCQGVGYSGRLGVYELMIFDDPIRETLLRSQDSKAIKKIAVERGMKTLRDSAFQKVLQGLTSLDEAIQNTQTDDLELPQ